MSKDGERSYASSIGDDGRRRAAEKPYSDAARGRYLQQMGVVLDHLPAPPARILDLGCGTGWTTEILHRSGHEVVGVDIAGDMIELARTVPARRDIEFVVGDYEAVGGLGQFDGVLFFDCLHHADEPEQALRCAFDALRPGGRVVLSEPGVGHHLTAESLRAMEDFGVNEKEMPPSLIAEMATRVGFTDCTSFAYPFEVQEALAQDPTVLAAAPLAANGYQRSVRGQGARALDAVASRVPLVERAVTTRRYLRTLWSFGPGFVASGRGGFTVLVR